MSRWLPPNVSTYGGEIDRLFYIIYYLTGITFLLVAGAMIAFLIIYRDRGDGRRAIYSHGNNTLELIWTIIPSVIFLLLGLASAKSWAHIKINPPEPDMTVRLEAKQFNWTFTYTGPDGKFDTADDYNFENHLYVPIGKKVRVMLTAKDVIHSFYVPQFRLKQDAVPGREIPTWFEATAAGSYELPCAELCGYGHTTMIGWVRVFPADRREWASVVRPDLDGKDPVKGLEMLTRRIDKGWATGLASPPLAPPPVPTELPMPSESPTPAASPTPIL